MSIIVMAVTPDSRFHSSNHW